MHVKYIGSLTIMNVNMQPCLACLDISSSVKTQEEFGGIISYIFGGLDPSYIAFIISFNFATRDSSLSFVDFQA